MTERKRMHEGEEKSRSALTRRDLLRRTGLAALSAALSGTAGAASGKAQTPKAGEPPNIVLILCDDLGYGDVGCYNAESKIPTTHMDRLASQGIRFTDAHAPAAVCSPSRYGLLTGQYPWRTRPQGGALGIWAGPIIAADRPTVPGVLRRKGYATACIGKWHLGWTWPTRDGKPPRTGADGLSNVDFTKPIADGPTAHGFDTYFGTCVPNYPPYCFIENDRTVGLPDRPCKEFEFPGPGLAGWRQEEILPTLTSRAVQYIENASKTKRPFFLYLPLTSPHHPVLPTPVFQGKSHAGAYGDFVTQTDWTIGRVLAALDRTGLADKTVVIVTSDNGPELTRKTPRFTVLENGAYDRIQTYGHASMGLLRGAKYDAWEGGHREPFIARWPGRIEPGTVSDQLICLTDMMATLAAAAGATVPAGAGEDSCNVLPALLGGKSPRTSAVLQSSGAVLAMQRGDWVLTTAYGGLRPEPEWLQRQRGYAPRERDGCYLYNLRTDPAQRRDVCAEHPEVVRELLAELERCRRDGRSAAPAER